ncbi:MAG: hypothetical protein Q4C00_01875 [Bacillota bacterium]|nr:hypothetical protein [Bacillota bacterium]
MNLLNVRILKDKEIEELYKEHFIKDFPPSEQKPLSMILNLKNQGKYICFGLFENHILKGYAILGLAPERRNLLLDYFAILSPYRSGGYGGRFLQLLKGALNEYEGLILEVENVDHAANPEEELERTRRLAFYYANGLEHTNIETSVKKVVFTIIYFPFRDKWQEQELVEDINAIYPELYGASYEESFDYIRILK